MGFEFLKDWSTKEENTTLDEDVITIALYNAKGLTAPIQTVNTMGTPMEDWLIGSNDRDEIDGGNGDDYIFGGGGGDVLNGGEVFGGNDTIDGGAGDDSIRGIRGDDDLYGGIGNDQVSGGDGNDIIFGGSGNDDLNGGDHNDTMMGDDGNDSLRGDDGDDLLYDGAGNDTVSGGAGNDRIVDEGGSDTYRGGEGADVFEFTGQFIAGDGDVIQDFGEGDRLILHTPEGGRMGPVFQAYVGDPASGMPPVISTFFSFFDADGGRHTITVMGLDYMSATESTVMIV